MTSPDSCSPCASVTAPVMSYAETKKNIAKERLAQSLKANLTRRKAVKRPGGKASGATASE